MKPKLLDLFSGAGGCTKGYQQAGFHVTGVDIKPMPHYCGDEFYQADAMTFPLDGFVAIHASPPCQAFVSLRKMWNAKQHLDLLTPTRERLEQTGLPYVIENVPGSPIRASVMLCGSQFGLACDTAELRRHRYFETNWTVGLTPPCNHGWLNKQTITVVGHAHGRLNDHRAKQRAGVIGVYGGHGRDRRRSYSCQDFSTQDRREAMGIDWMTGNELSQAIPPAYTKFIGDQLMAYLRQKLETIYPIVAELEDTKIRQLESEAEQSDF